jgi:hypothetical protein
MSLEMRERGVEMQACSVGFAKLETAFGEQTDDYRSLILSDKLVSLIGNTLATMRTAMRLMRL